MNALAKEPLEQTFVYSPGEAAVEFTYKSGARPLEGYTIKRGLGVGGFGEVYFAVSDGGKEVALKLIQRHLDIELRGVSQCLNLKHPHLVATFDVRTSAKGENWVVMEYMSGDSLQARLDKLGRAMSVEEALDWLRGIAAAVDFLHEHGIVHRDLKPGNVFSERDVVKVGDYGLSKFISNSRRSGQTQSIGTVHYMAPEISTGNYGRSIDVYAAAVIAFETLTGTVPFDGETTGEILMKHLTAEPELEKVESRFRPLFARALAKSPSDRPPSVGAFVDELATTAGIASAASAALSPPPAAPTKDAGNAPTPPPMPARPAARPARPRVRPSLAASIPPEPGTFAAKRRALGDFFWQMFLTGILSALLSIVAMAVQVFLQENRPDPRDYVALMVLAGVASWGLLGFARVWDDTRPPTAVRRLHTLILGMLLGAGALLLDGWLDRHGVAAKLPKGVLEGAIGPENFEEMLPILLSYLAVGGVLFAVPDWARSVCRSRRVGFSVWHVLWPTSLGIFVGLVVGAPDPFWLGIVLGLVAAITQWVSPHEPYPLRRVLRARIET